MLRLERAAESRPEFHEIKTFAYAEAQRDIKALYGKTGSKLRFTEKQPLVQINDGTRDLKGAELYEMNVASLRQKIKAMNKFLDSASSTIGAIYKGGKMIKQGIKDVFNKRLRTINNDPRFGLKEAGIKLTGDDLTRFFNSRKQAKIESMVGSNNMFVVAAVMKKHNIGSKKEILKYFRDNISKEDIERNNIRLSEKDWKGTKEKKVTAADVYDQLKKYASLTGDPVLDDYIGEALRKKISYKDLFIS